jgi:hypothetical protein
MATVIDCCTKECIGYAIADHMRAELVIDALRMAARNHSLEPGATFHTDRGSQYLSKSFAETMTYRGDMCVKIVCAAARAGALPPWLVGPLSPPLVGVTLRKARTTSVARCTRALGQSFWWTATQCEMTMSPGVGKRRNNTERAYPENAEQLSLTDLWPARRHCPLPWVVTG